MTEVEKLSVNTGGKSTAKAYKTPELEFFGMVSDLTLGNGSFCMDGNSGSQGNNSCKPG
jgi:hypothetical protein